LAIETNPRPGRHCIKCGREVGPDETICAICNRAGMATPSATQYHGTIVVAIVTGVVIMAIAASLSLRGIGPFRAEMVGTRASPPDGVLVTVRLSNAGTKSGRANCLLVALDSAGGRLASHSVVSPQVGAGTAITFVERVPGLPAPPAQVTVSCS
jgi:predicted nucleic acid-binding Zn ribbon protein